MTESLKNTLVDTYNRPNIGCYPSGNTNLYQSNWLLLSRLLKGITDNKCEGVKPTPPGVSQKLEPGGSKKSKGVQPLRPPANRTLRTRHELFSVFINRYANFSCLEAVLNSINFANILHI